jgi:hypothetical protein
MHAQGVRSRVLRIELGRSAPQGASAKSLAQRLVSAIHEAPLEGYSTLSLILETPELLALGALACQAARTAGLAVHVTTNAQTLNHAAGEELMGAVNHWLLRVNSGCEPLTGQNAVARHEALALALARLRQQSQTFSLLCSIGASNLNDLAWATHLAGHQAALGLTVELAPVRYNSPGAGEEKLGAEQRVWAMLVLARACQRYPNVHYEIDLADTELVRHEPQRVLAEPIARASGDSKLSDWVSPLVITSTLNVLPLLASLSPRFALGNLDDQSLTQLAVAWKLRKAPAFRSFCQRIHSELCRNSALPFFSWTEELLLHSRRLDAVALRDPDEASATDAAATSLASASEASLNKAIPWQAA